MQINNNQPNFKGVSFTTNAQIALKKRLSSDGSALIQNRLIKRYENSPFDIIIDTKTNKSVRLTAKIKELKQIKNILKMWFVVDFYEENLFSSIFCSPEKFLEKLCINIDKQELYFLKNNFKKKIKEFSDAN